MVFDELKQSAREIEFLDDPTAGQIKAGCAESFMAGTMKRIASPLFHQHRNSTARKTCWCARSPGEVMRRAAAGLPSWPADSNRQRSPLVRYFGRVARMGKAPSQEQCLTGAGHRHYSHCPQFSKQDGSHISLPITRASKA
jgi:hypothetical protein